MLCRILVLFLFYSVGSAFAGKEPIAKFYFNNGVAANDLGSSKVRSSSVLFLEDRFGNAKSACYFHGSLGSYMNLGTGKILKPNNITISLWAKMEIAILGGRGFQFNPIIVTKNKNGDDFCEAYCMSYDFKNRKLVFTCDLNEEHAVRSASPDTFALRQWHHLVMAFNDDSVYTYIDGQLNSRLYKGFRTEYLEGDSIMLAGTASKKNERYYSGCIDDILIYDRVLSEREIQDLYNEPDPNRVRTFLKWAGWILFILLLTGSLSFLIIRSVRKRYDKENQLNRMNSRLLELETRAVRSQMNPHFVFNSLNTLMRFILEEDFANSHLYLTKFSILLRKLLESSTHDSILLSEETEILKMYIEIEKLRFNTAFEYEVNCEIQDMEKIHIPFMMVQPFVENAIWHGLLHKHGNCRLSVTFRNKTTDSIQCIIEDNGVGRGFRTEENKERIGKRSVAIELIRQRLNLLEKTTNVKCSLNINDLVDYSSGQSAGTRVEITIPKLHY